jgi:hypothetical protein
LVMAATNCALLTTPMLSAWGDQQSQRVCGACRPGGASVTLGVMDVVAMAVAMSARRWWLCAAAVLALAGADHLAFKRE